MVLLCVGCTSDVRPDRLRLAADRLEPVLHRPELVALAGGHQPERLVLALFSPEGLKLWPPQAASQTSYEAPLEPPGCLPPRIIVSRAPDVPWSLVVKPEGTELIVAGYGQSLSAPLFVRRVSL